MVWGNKVRVFAGERWHSFEGFFSSSNRYSRMPREADLDGLKFAVEASVGIEHPGLIPLLLFRLDPTLLSFCGGIEYGEEERVPPPPEEDDDLTPG